MPGGEPVKQVSIVTITTLLRKHKLLLSVTTVLVTAGFVLYAWMEPSTYKSKVLLSTDPIAAEDYLRTTAPVPVNVQEKLWLVRENLLSPTTLEPLIREFHLDRPNDDPLTRFSKFLDRQREKLPFVHAAEAPYSKQQELTLEALKKKITIQVEARDAFSIAFEGRDPQQAADVTNRLAEALVRRTSAATERNVSSAADFLQAEVNRVKRKLDRQNQSIQRYQESAAGDLPARMARDLKTLESQQEKIHAQNERIANAQARRAAIVGELQDLKTHGALGSKGDEAADTRLQDLRLQLKQLRATYTEEYPAIKSLEKEIQDVERSAAGAGARKNVGQPTTAEMKYLELKAQLAAIDQQLRNDRRRQNELVSQMALYQEKAQTAPRYERTLAQLTRDYELTRTQYQTLLEKQSQAQIDAQLRRTNPDSVFRIVSKARVPLEPSGPHRARLALMGLAAGLGFGLIFAFVSDVSDTSYDNADEFKESIDLPVLAAIPAIPLAAVARSLPSAGNRSALPVRGLDLQPKTRAVAKPAVVTLSAPTSIAAEQYGMLAMEVRHRLGRDSSRVLAITSAAGGEGKTITSLNLSIALSKTMEGKVLLVDSDLRKPRVHECAGIRSERGFSDLLQNPDDALDPYIRRVNGLAIIPGGRAMADPLPLLASEESRAIFQRLRREFKFIVVDTPPIVPVADSHVLSDLADGVVVVVRARHTRRELLKYALHSFHASNVIGVVLNGVDFQKSRYYGAYEYYANEYLGRRKAV